MHYFSAPGIPSDSYSYSDRLFKIVKLRLGITKKQLQSKSKKRAIVIPRQIICDALYRSDKFTLVQIGRLMGDRDYSTIIRAIKTIQTLVEVKNPEVLEIYNKLNFKIPNGNTT